jgi:mitogen-activated protein kinase organizer 1
MNRESSVLTFLLSNSDDGKYCLTAGTDRTVRLWNPSRLDPAYPPTGLSAIDDDRLEVPISRLPRALPIQVYEDGIRYTPTAISVSDDSTRLLVASDKAAVLLDSVSTKVLRTFHGHVAVINSVAMNSNICCTASYDATVCVWDGRSNNSRPIQALKDAKDSVTSVDIGQSTIRTASVDGCLRIYDIRKGVVLCDNYQSPITCVARSKNDPDNGMMAVTCLDGVIRVKRDDANLQQSDSGYSNPLSLSVPLICRNGHMAGQYALECSFSADSSFLVSGSEDGRAILYDTSSASNQPASDSARMPSDAPIGQELVGHTAPTCSVAAHPMHVNNNIVITASYDGNCVVWADSRDYMRWVD